VCERESEMYIEGGCGALMNLGRMVALYLSRRVCACVRVSEKE